MHQSVVYVKLKLLVQSTPVNPNVFIQMPITITYSVRSHVSLNVCTQIEAGSTNGRTQVAWSDVT